jgi:hypothetical protein
MSSRGVIAEEQRHADTTVQWFDRGVCLPFRTIVSTQGADVADLFHMAVAGADAALVGANGSASPQPIAAKRYGVRLAAHRPAGRHCPTASRRPHAHVSLSDEVVQSRNIRAP